MDVRVLGSGGNTPIPTPTCTCGVCEQARTEGVPYARGGNSLYLPGLSAMVDAPESAFAALNREGITDLDLILLTHWHPDHVNGLRVLQSRDVTAHDGFVEGLIEDGPTIVTTRAVYRRTCDVFGQLEHFVEDRGFADVRFLDERPLSVGNYEVRSIPYSLDGAEIDATAFVVETADRTVVIASDDARHLPEERFPASIDLAVFECGLFERGPDGTALLSETDRAFLEDELTHEEVLARVERVAPELTLLTEIEHLTARSFDHFRDREASPEYDGLRFAYDGLELSM